jgi:hypothetical protein
VLKTHTGQGWEAAARHGARALSSALAAVPGPLHNCGLGLLGGVTAAAAAGATAAPASHAEDCALPGVLSLLCWLARWCCRLLLCLLRVHLERVKVRLLRLMPG